MKLLARGSVKALSNAGAYIITGSIVGAILVPSFQKAQGVTFDEAAATVAVLLITFFCSLRATAALFFYALTRDRGPVSNQDPTLERALMPLAVASACLVLLMTLIVAVAASLLIYSPLGIDLAWAFNSSVVWLRWLAVGTVALLVLAFTYLVVVLVSRHWQHVRQEVREMRTIVESELVGAWTSRRQAA